MREESVDILFAARNEIKHCMYIYNANRTFFDDDSEMEGECLYYIHNLIGGQRKDFIDENPIDSRNIVDLKRVLNLQ